MKLTWGNILVIYIIAFAGMSVSSCSGQQKKEKTVNRKALEESLIQANKQLVQKESEDIDDFLQRRNWNMKKSGSGLRYMIYEEGQGRTPAKGDRVKFNYSLSLLSGDTIESSENDKHLTFRVGKENVISGLHETARLMKEGDRAKVIIPSHLAYGLTGVPDKIPPRATLVYDLRLLEIN